MGQSSYKGGQEIEIYVETTTDMYTVGEFIDGIVYLINKKAIERGTLRLRFKCVQNVRITEQDKQQTKECIVNGITYEEIFTIYQFKTQLQPGMYSFPFSFLLPSQLPGSIQYSEKNYLRYVISSQLFFATLKLPDKKLSEKVKNQPLIKSNQFVVHITEPFRLPLTGIHQKVTNYPQCCGCCQSYGTVHVKFQANKNYIKSGQQIKIKAEIDNTNGNVPITNIRVIILQHLHLTSPQGHKSYWQNRESTLYQLNGYIVPNISYVMQFESMIPASLNWGSSSVGSIIANYHTLQIKSEMGICSHGANIKVAIFYHSTCPKMYKNIKVKKPSFLTLIKQFPKVKYTDMKAYSYHPIGSIPFHLNRTSVINSKQKFENMQRMKINADNNFPKYTITYNTITRPATNPSSIGKAPSQINVQQKEKQRQVKYKDEQSQHDYDEFKDFPSANNSKSRQNLEKIQRYDLNK